MRGSPDECILRVPVVTRGGSVPFREGDENMLQRATLLLTLSAITAVVLALGAGRAPAAPKTSGVGKTICCTAGKVCQAHPTMM